MDKTVLEKLKKIPLFSEIKDNDELMDQLLNICKKKSYAKGSTVIKEDDVGSEMYIVFRGGVEIQKKTRAGDPYTVAKLRVEDNVFFGEMSLIDDEPRSATIIAIEDSEFLVITKEEFLKKGNDCPSIGLPITRAISQILAARLRKTTKDMLTIFDALVNEISG